MQVMYRILCVFWSVLACPGARRTQRSGPHPFGELPCLGCVGQTTGCLPMTTSDLTERLSFPATVRDRPSQDTRVLWTAWLPTGHCSQFVDRFSLAHLSSPLLPGPWHICVSQCGSCAAYNWGAMWLVPASQNLFTNISAVRPILFLAVDEAMSLWDALLHVVGRLGWLGTCKVVDVRPIA